MRHISERMKAARETGKRQDQQGGGVVRDRWAARKLVMIRAPGTAAMGARGRVNADSNNPRMGKLGFLR